MMTDNERDGFRALMDALCERFGRQPMSLVTVSLSFAAIQDELPDVTLTELTTAVRKLLKTSKFMPTDADLIDAVNDDLDRNTAPCHRQFALPPRVETDEETRAAMEDAKRRIRACAAQVGKRMPNVDDPWSDDGKPRLTTDQIAQRREAKQRAREILESLTERND